MNPLSAQKFLTEVTMVAGGRRRDMKQPRSKERKKNRREGKLLLGEGKVGKD